MPKTLIVTNDFPTRQGGIEGFVAALAERFDPTEVVVYTATMPGCTEFDATLPYQVIRDPASMLLPTARVRRAVTDALRDHGCDRVLFGASAPLGLLAGPLRKAGAERIVAITHSAETWWSRLPLARSVIRSVGEHADTVTFINDWCGAVISRAMTPAARTRMRRLHPGVDSTRFHPGAGGEQVRAELGIAPDAPVVVCASRVVPRKGQDMLIQAWPEVCDAVEGATLLIVGDGPYRAKLTALVQNLGLEDRVIFTGPIPWAEVPRYVDAGDVFAMPSRTRYFGLEPEGLPLAFLEGAATGLPVVAGRSGGAVDAIDEAVTGFAVDPRDPHDIARRIVELLADPERARAMGEAGRARVARDWQWDQVAARARHYLGYPEQLDAAAARVADDDTLPGGGQPGSDAVRDRRRSGVVGLAGLAALVLVGILGRRRFRRR